MFTLWACNKGEDLSVPENQGKTAIALSAGVTGGSPATKQALTLSVTTTGETGAKAFPAGTSVYLVLKSEKDDKDAVYTRTIGYLQGVARNRASTLLTLLRGVVFMAAAFVVLPHWMGTVGLWLAEPAAELLTLLVILAAWGLSRGKMGRSSTVSEKQL